MCRSDGVFLARLSAYAPVFGPGLAPSALGISGVRSARVYCIRQESHMRAISVGLIALALSIAAVSVRASEIKESDYPNQYEVMMTNKTSKMMINKSCAMTLRDRAKPNVA